jgi:hypothetical protein
MQYPPQQQMQYPPQQIQYPQIQNFQNIEKQNSCGDNTTNMFIVAIIFICIYILINVD